MADVEGKWECYVETPMGGQDFVLSVTRNGDRFSGEASGSVGAMAIPDGLVDGDTLKWSMAVSKPMPITLTCEATVAGDALDGKVSAGIFGSFPINGKRAT
jgi:hypothetical protein